MENGTQQAWKKRSAQDLCGETRRHMDKKKEGGTGSRQTRDNGAWAGEGHPGVGKVYHLSLLCGEAWMDSSCQTSIYRAA